jgi:hypothetical protein
MNDPSEVLLAIARVRRAMPRNPDVMLVCSELEARLVTVTATEIKPKFDRNAYQREYMRKRRKAEEKK